MIETVCGAKPLPRDTAPTLPAIGPINLSTLISDPNNGDTSRIPVEIEIGPGRGSFLIQRASNNPDIAIIGFEIRLKLAKLVDDKLSTLGLHDRARVFAADARSVLPRLTPDERVSAFYLHFPDPWWKKRHQKRAVISPSLIGEIIRLLVPHGIVFVQTDVPERSDQFESLLSASTSLAPFGDVPGSPRLSQTPWREKSNREIRVIEAGIEPTRLCYRKTRES